VGLAASAAVMTAGSALAANGSEPGNLTLSPASGATSLTPTWATSDGCPANFQGSAVLDEFTPAGVFRSRISTVLNSGLTAPFGAGSTLDGTVAQMLNLAGVSPGGTVEWAVACYSAGGGTGNSEYVQSTFVTLDSTGANYSTASAPPGPVATTTVLTASPNPDPGSGTPPVFGTVTLTATETPATAGSVQFMVGGTNIGAAVAVNASGVATTTTTPTAAGSEALSAVFTPTNTTGFLASTGNTTLGVGITQATGNNPVPVTFTVPSTGTLAVSVNAGTAALTVTGSTATGTMPNVQIIDTRNLYPGWSVSGQEANFTGSGSATGATMSGDQLGWVPAFASGFPSVDNATVGPTVAPTAPGLGTTPGLLAQAVHGNGFGTNTVTATLNLVIPASQLAGPYAGQLNITYVSAN
jgi:hypothetical protein